MKKILFIHGFAALKEDNEFLISYLNKKFNTKVITFNLPGHDGKFSKTTFDKWLQASEEQLKELLDNKNDVYLIGHSMGGVIAAYLATKYKIKKLILIAPAFKKINFEQNKRDFVNLLNNQVDNNLGTGFEGFLNKFVTVPFKNVIEFKKLINYCNKDLDKITCPTLILHGDVDNVVPLSSSLYIYDLLKCKKHMTIIKNVRHQVFKSNRKKEIAKYIYSFILGSFIFKINKKDIL